MWMSIKIDFIVAIFQNVIDKILAYDSIVAMDVSSIVFVPIEQKSPKRTTFRC